MLESLERMSLVMVEEPRGEIRQEREKGRFDRSPRWATWPPGSDSRRCFCDGNR